MDGIVPKNSDTTVNKKFNPILHICYLHTALTYLQQSN